MYILLVEELLELGGTFIVKAVELRFAAASCQGAMDVCYGIYYVTRCPAFDRLQQDTVAVVIIRDNEVFVAGAGWVWEPSGLVRVYDVAGFGGGNEACICPCRVAWLQWEVVECVFV